MHSYNFAKPQNFVSCAIIKIVATYTRLVTYLSIVNNFL